MTLTAINAAGQVVDGRLLLDPRQRSDFDQLKCPISLQPVIPVRQYVRSDRSGVTSAHFRHRSPAQRIPWPADVAFDPEYGNERDGLQYLARESAWHLAGKTFVAGLLEAETADIPDAQVLVEHRIAVGDGRWRVADVAVLIGGQVREVHEIQLSVLPIELINARDDDYNSVEAATCWWLGRDAADSAEIRRHIRSCHGGFYELLAAPDDDRREPSRLRFAGTEAAG